MTTEKKPLQVVSIKELLAEGIINITLFDNVYEQLKKDFEKIICKEEDLER